MKKLTKIIAVIAIAFAFTTAQATQSDDEFCAGEADVAEAIMKARQSGVAMSEMLKFGAPGPNPYRQLIISAYELPRMSYAPNQEKMIQDFRNEYHLLCFKAIENVNKKAPKKKKSPNV